MVCTATERIAMVREYTLPLGQKLNPQRNPHTMDYQKLYRHMAIEHELFLLDSQMEEIVDIVLEMHNEKPETCTEAIKNQSNNDQMKTAMQELIDDLREFRDEQTSPLVISIMNKVLLKASLLTTKEKEQIVNAYNSGQQIPPFEFAEKYYNETYGDDK
jgi:hypothetical protein